MYKSKKTSKLITVAIFLMLLMSFRIFTVKGEYDSSFGVYDMAYAEEVQQVEEYDVTKDQVDVENVDPAASEKLQNNLSIPEDTLLVFGGIIVILGICVAITVIVSNAARKRNDLITEKH